MRTTLSVPHDMPPKPRGLAASRKRAAVEPAVPAVEPEEVVRTFPLDEDSLTLSNLFELRQTITNLLLTPGQEGEAERQEEARGLIRGILHAAQGLHAALPTLASTSTLTPDAEAHLNALGLLSPLAAAKLAYLQAFALHEMSSILPPPLSVVSVSSAAIGADGPSKKRKVDPSEPTSAVEWLELASLKYESARESLPRVGVWEALIDIELARALADRAVIALLGDRQSEEGKTLFGETEKQFLQAIIALAVVTTTPPTAEEEEDLPDVAASLLRFLSIFIPFVEDFANPTSLAARLASVGFVGIALGSSLLSGETTPLRRVDIAIVKADFLMAQFSMREVGVTEKYREIVEEEEETEDDEAVVPLPDAEDVREARESGREGEFRFSISVDLRSFLFVAIAALEESIAAFEQVPAAERSVSLQRSQHLKVSFFTSVFCLSADSIALRQLQEAYLTYEMLLDEKDVEELEWCTAGGEKVSSLIEAKP